LANDVFEILKSGLTTSVQDLGRSGYQQYGMVVSGAIDPFALQVGNILVGNKRNTAGIEVVIMGPKIRILKDTVLAICGADLSPKIDGTPVPLWKSVTVKSGQILSFGQPKDGSFAYITAAGGIDVPIVMGSKSTYAKAAIGGVNGGYLQKGDRLQTGDTSFPFIASRSLPAQHISRYQSGDKIRVILGPDQDAFTPSSVETFLTEKYQKTSKSDRMGSRIKGPALKHKAGADIISDAIFPGTVQVPANGEPIILLAERQTTGGYTRIATVITVDIPYIAQLLPEREIQFEAVKVEEAQRLYLEQEKLLRKLSINNQ